MSKELLIPFPSDEDGDFRDGKEIKSWMNGWEQGFREAQKELYTEEEVRKLLEVQRGNCYVAVYNATTDQSLAKVASSAPEPGHWIKETK